MKTIIRNILALFLPEWARLKRLETEIAEIKKLQAASGKRIRAAVAAGDWDAYTAELAPQQEILRRIDGLKKLQPPTGP